MKHVRLDPDGKKPFKCKIGDVYFVCTENLNTLNPILMKETFQMQNL